MANPTLIAFAEVDTGTTSVTGSNVTTASLTWLAGDILVAVAVGEGGANGDSFGAPVNTGSGLTWTQQQLHAAASDPQAGAWTAVASAGSSGTVKITSSGTGGEAIALGVYQFRAPTGNTIAVGATKLATGQGATTPHAALTMTSANSSVVWVGGDWSASTAETVAPAATSHTTTTPGPSASPKAAKEGTHYTFYIDDLDNEASTGTINFGYSGSAVGPFTIIAVEVTITASGGSTFTDTATGTLTLTGATTESKVGTNTATGVLTLTGAKTESLTGTNTATGTLTLSGAKTESAAFTQTASGTLTLTGATTEALAHADAPAGTLLITGTDTESSTHGFNDTGTGTLILSGAVTEAAAFTQAAGGTLTLSGAASAAHIDTDTASGTLLFSGAGSAAPPATGPVMPDFIVRHPQRPGSSPDHTKTDQPVD